METLNKKRLVIISIIVIYCTVYALLGTFPIITYFNPLLTPYFSLSILIFFVFLVLWASSFLIQKTGKFKHRGADWLKLHFTFHVLEVVFLGLFFIMIAISVATIRITEEPNKYLFYCVWYIFFGTGVFPFFHRVRNVLGMEFKEIEKASLNGASAFAELAKLKLKKKEEKGLDYLMGSLIMLRDYLTHYGKQLESLNKTISIVNTISLYGDKIPYRQLFSLSENLIQLSTLERIPEAVNKFLKTKEIGWTQDFTEIPQRKKGERIGLFVEKYVLPIVIVLVTFLAVFPEDIRMPILDFIKQIDWLQLLGIFIFFFLFYETWLFLSRMIELSYSDIKEVSETS